MVTKNKHLKLLGCVSLAAFMASMHSTSFAQDDSDMPSAGQDALLQRIEKLEGEIKSLKTHHNRARHHKKKSSCCNPEKAVATQGDVQRLEQKIEQVDATSVKTGTLDNSYRVPGTDMDVRLYGIARMNGMYDTGSAGTGLNYEFMLANGTPLEGSDQGKRKNQYHMNARESRFGFETNTTTKYGNLGAHLEMDFMAFVPDGTIGQTYNNNGVVRMRLAYATFGHWLVGQTATNFYSLDASPESLDLGVASGIGANRQPQVRYTHKFDGEYKGLSTAFSVEQPEGDVMDWKVNKLSSGKAYGLTITNSNVVLNRRPDITARVDKEMAGCGFGASALLREIRVRTSPSILPTPANTYSDSVNGYGIGVDAYTKLNETNKLMFQAHGGNGIGRYILDAAGQAAFLDSAGKLHLQGAYGGIVSYQHFWTPEWRSNFTVGMTQVNNSPVLRGYTKATIYDATHQNIGLGGTSATTDGVGMGVNRRMRTLHANLIWSPVEAMDIGAAFSHSDRLVEDGRKGINNRFIFSLNYKFGAAKHQNKHRDLPG